MKKSLVAILSVCLFGGIALTVTVSSVLSGNFCIGVCQQGESPKQQQVPTPLKTTAPAEEQSNTKEPISAPELVSKTGSFKLECREDKRFGFVLVGVQKSEARGLLGISTGLDVWGDFYDHKTRCNQILTKTLRDRYRADGWSGGEKNGYPVICSSYRGKCLEDDKGEVLEVATFRRNRGIDPMEEARKLTARVENIPSVYTSMPVTGGESELRFDLVFR
jgi:hypothetical protein